MHIQNFTISKPYYFQFHSDSFTCHKHSLSFYLYIHVHICMHTQCTLSFSRSLYTWGWRLKSGIFLITFNLIFMTGSFNEPRGERFCKNSCPVSSMHSCIYFLSARTTNTPHDCCLWVCWGSEFMFSWSCRMHFTKSSFQALL